MDESVKKFYERLKQSPKLKEELERIPPQHLDRVVKSVYQRYILSVTGREGNPLWVKQQRDREAKDFLERTGISGSEDGLYQIKPIISAMDKLTIFEALLLREISRSRAELWKNSEPRYIYISDQPMGGEELIPTLEKFSELKIVDVQESSAVNYYTVNELGQSELAKFFARKNL